MSAKVELDGSAGRGADRPDPAARAFALAPLLDAAAPRIEAERRLPEDVLAVVHGAGLFRTLLPRAYGGEELDPASHVLMLEEVAAADASTAWCIGQGTGCSMAAAYVEPAVARAIWGDDPRAVLAWGMGGAVDGGQDVLRQAAFRLDARRRGVEQRSQGAGGGVRSVGAATGRAGQLDFGAHPGAPPWSAGASIRLRAGVKASRLAGPGLPTPDCAANGRG